MASEEKVSSKNSTQNLKSSDVITLSSDEEDNEESSQDVDYLFDRFTLVCRPHVAKEALACAREIFKTTPRDRLCSKEITDILKRSMRQVKKDNATSIVDDICKTMRIEKSAKKVVVRNHNNTIHDRNLSNDSGLSDVTNARDFKETPTITNGAVDVAEVSDDGVNFVCERKRSADIASTSSAHQGNKLKLPKSGKISTRNLSSKQKKKLVMNLKRRLKEISQEIKILNKSELTLDEMDMDDSTYIKENRLKKKFDKTWNKLCKIRGRAPNTGRVVEKKIRPSSTGYSIIDKEIERFINEKCGKFPDYFDIRDVVLKTNERHDLRMAPQVLKGIIADVFTDIGNKLQRLRERDLIFNFGSHLLDDFKSENDPALTDEELSKRLEKNRKIAKRHLKQVYARYTHLERYGKSEKKGGPSTNEAKRRIEGNGSTESDITTTDDEQETSRNMTGISWLSDEEDSVHLTPSCSSSTTSNTTRSIVHDHARGMEIVSLISDSDTMDCSQPCTSSAVVTDQDPVTTANIETDNCVENSSQVLNDDCCIIEQLGKEACVSNSQQPCGLSATTEHFDVFEPEKNHRSHTSHVDLSNECVSNEDNRVKLSAVGMQSMVDETPSKKRKASTELHVEELKLAIKVKKLKPPRKCAAENPTKDQVIPVVSSEMHGEQPLPAVKDSSSVSKDMLIDSQQKQKFRENTYIALNLTPRGCTKDQPIVIDDD